MFVLSLSVVCLMFVGMYAVNPIQMSVVETRDPNYDECDDAFIEGSIVISPQIDDLDTIMSPCVYGTMNPGDYFTVKFYHLSNEVSELEKSYVYEGIITKIKALKDKVLKYGEVAANIQPSSTTALFEIITAKVFRNDESDSIGEFTIEMSRPEQRPGGTTNAFAVLSSKPTLRKHCESDSSDLSDTVAAGAPFYVCVIFYNPICPTNDFEDAVTTFDIDVQGNDGGLIVDLTPTNSLQPYTCGDSLINAKTVWRFVEIKDYGSLDSIDLAATMDSYGAFSSVADQRTF